MDNYMKQTYIHGYKVKYEDNAYSGVDYLKNDLDSKEASVFFNEARRRSQAPFEDDDDRDFILSRNSDGSYCLRRR